MSFEHYDTNLRVHKGINIHRTDPYGFWIVDHPDVNMTFTQPRLAQQYIDSALEKGLLKIKEPEPVKPTRRK